MSLKNAVLLNRAPTLHRLGIQAFEPVLIDRESSSFAPACVWLMPTLTAAIHVPLSEEAQAEARILMLAAEHPLNQRR